MPTAMPQNANGTHPCFYAEAGGKYGRLHLPVAPDCNIQCAYCRRDYDCPNENRPGVTKGILTPEEAADRVETALMEMPAISVVAIAGPGDAFSDAERTLRTFRLIRNRNSDTALCVSTNGLNIKHYIPQLRDLNVRFVTITVNAIDPGIGAQLCKHSRVDGRILYGAEAARVLISRQLEAIAMLKAADFTVKINSVVVPGINEDHVLFLARKMGELRVDLMNLLPLIPVAGTELENTPPPTKERMARLRQKASVYVSQMHHCTRCRSDAAGYTGAFVQR